VGGPHLLDEIGVEGRVGGYGEDGGHGGDPSVRRSSDRKRQATTV
jgi:hypothetical protein